MANPQRGEIEAEIGGKRRPLRLTLGALAELEARLGASDIGDLARRLAGGEMKARDAIAIIGAGLRGAGEAVSDEEVAAMEISGGAPAYADIVVRLMLASFGVSNEPTPPFQASAAARCPGRS